MKPFYPGTFWEQVSIKVNFQFLCDWQIWRKQAHARIISLPIKWEFQTAADWMTRRTLGVVWGVGPSGRGNQGGGDAYRILQLDLFEGFLPEQFSDTLSYLCLVHHSPRGTHQKVFCRIILQNVPSVVPVLGIGIGRRRALYNKRYRNDLPCLEKSDMTSPTFDIGAFFLHRPSYTWTQIRHCTIII